MFYFCLRNQPDLLKGVTGATAGEETFLDFFKQIFISNIKTHRKNWFTTVSQAMSQLLCFWDFCFGFCYTGLVKQNIKIIGH